MTDAPATPRKRGRPRQMIPVRVKILVNADGKWAAYGWNDATDEGANDCLCDMMGSEDITTARSFYLVAKVPYPHPQEISARVRVPDDARGSNRGGIARAAALSPARRSEIAAMGARVRWASEPPKDA